jgi:hypothetical protein
LFLKLKGKLTFSDSFVRAGSFAGAAIDALVLVDLVGGVTGGDSAHRAYVCARTARDAKFRVDYSRHSLNLLLLLC